MFYYLDGAVAEILPGLAVIDCGGVGYACLTTNHTLSQLRKGERGKLYTYLNVGESVFDLYGFASSKELESCLLYTSLAPTSAISSRRTRSWPCAWPCFITSGFTMS